MSQFVDHESDIIFSLLTQQDARTIFLNIFCAYPVLKKKKEALKYMVLAKVQRWKWIWISSVPKSKKDFLFQNQTFFPEIDGHEPACRRQGRSHQTKHIIEMDFYSRKAIERIDQHYFRSLCREFIWFPFESPVLLNEKCVVLYQNVEIFHILKGLI